jgi:prepilin-type N-terminal cleavage/methylation domain-containing protein
MISIFPDAGFMAASGMYKEGLSMLRKHLGFTLLELLIAVAIILLLAALLLPVLGSVRERARMSSCISNMRQVFVTWRSYVDDYGAYPENIVRLVQRHNAGVFLCPSDPWQGFNAAASVFAGYPISYFYANSLNNLDKRRAIEQADPNHGIVICVLHASYQISEFSRAYNRHKQAPEEYFNSDFPYPPAWRGTVLRLRLDGSVQAAQVKPRCYRIDESVTLIDVHPWYLFTDAQPCAWCGNIGQEVPCPY